MSKRNGGLKLKWSKVLIFLVAAFILFFVIYLLVKHFMKPSFRAYEPFEGGSEGKPAKTTATTTKAKETFVDKKKEKEEKEGFDPKTLMKPNANIKK